MKLKRVLMCGAGISLLAAATAQAAPQLPDHAAASNVKLHAQEATQWCWAASAQMIMEKYGRQVQQCTEANFRFSRSDCCAADSSPLCNQGGWPDFRHYGFLFSTTHDSPLTWDQLRSEIARKDAPFAFSWHWNGGGGHMMVAEAFKIVNGQKLLTIYDPWPPRSGDVRDISYESYVAAGNHTHWDDYYQVQLMQRPKAEALPASGERSANKEASQLLTFSAALEASRSTALRYLRQVAPAGPGGQKPTLGIPFANVYIGLDKLQGAAAPGGAATAVNALLAPRTDQVLYAFEAGGNVSSALMLERRNEHWDDSGEANTTITRELVGAREKYASEHHLPLTAFHSVSIPALNAYFVAVGEGAETLLIPVESDSSIGVVAGVPQRASALLPRLAAAASERLKHPAEVR